MLRTLIPTLLLVFSSCANPSEDRAASSPVESKVDQVLTLDQVLSHFAPTQASLMTTPWAAVQAAPLEGAITWDGQEALTKEGAVARKGTMKFSLQGGDLKEPAMEWEIQLLGSKAGYTSLVLSHFNSQEATTTDLDGLLGGSGYIARSVGECTQDPTFGWTKHELTFNGRIPGWMTVSWSAGSMGLGRSIEYNFDPQLGKRTEECL